MQYSYKTAGVMGLKQEVESTKSKKCDYCDEFAQYKMKEDGLSSYLCDWCYRHLDVAKTQLNPEE